MAVLTGVSHSCRLTVDSLPIAHGFWFDPDIIIVGTGRYSFMNSTICSVWPLTTFVDVGYHDSLGSFNSSLPSFINNTRAWREQPSPWLGQFAVDMFLRGVVSQGQSTRGSAVGDVVRGFAGTGVPGEDLTQHADKVPKILEAYVRGVMEFSVTVSKILFLHYDADISWSNVAFTNGLLR